MHNDLEDVLVYVVNCFGSGIDQESSDQDFIAKAREQDMVFDLPTFEQELNNDTVDLSNSFVRFFTVADVDAMERDENGNRIKL